MNAVVITICITGFAAAFWVTLRPPQAMRSPTSVPMSAEVLGQVIRDGLHAELAAAGLQAPQHADGLEELWEASK